MYAKIGVVSDATNIFDANITRREAVIRVLLSAALLSVFFIEPFVPLKIVFVAPALYLFVTAIMRWDPGYALMLTRKADYLSTTPGNLIKAIIQENIADKDGGSAINDPHDRKKAG